DNCEEMSIFGLPRRDEFARLRLAEAQLLWRDSPTKQFIDPRRRLGQANVGGHRGGQEKRRTLPTPLGWESIGPPMGSHPCSGVPAVRLPEVVKRSSACGP